MPVWVRERNLRVQQRGKDCVAGLGVETEQALGLRRREPEPGHLEVFRADSAQQFCRCDSHTDARPQGASLQQQNLPRGGSGEDLPLQAEHARRTEEAGRSTRPSLQ